MTKKEFWARFSVFSLFACVLPFAFIAWRYKIFNKISKMSLTGWGMIAMIIVFFFAIYLLKMVKKGLPYSPTTQIINGVAKVILPLVLLYALLTSMKGSIDLFLQCLLVVIICEIIAIPINPLPQWVHEQHLENLESVVDTLVNKGKKGEAK